MHFLERKPFILIIPLILLSAACNLAGGTKALSEPTPTVAAAAESSPTPVALPSPTATIPPTPMVVSSPTSAPTSENAMRIPDGPLLGDKNQTQAAMDTKVKMLRDAAESTQQEETSVRFQQVRYKIQAKRSDEPFLWITDWCAKDADTLKENLKSIQFELTANDKPVDLDYAVSASYSSGSLQCQMYFIVAYDWPGKTSTLISTTRILKPVSNGTYAYSAGTEYVDVYEVTNQSAGNSGSSKAGEGGFTFQGPAGLYQTVTSSRVDARPNSMTPSPGFTIYQLEGYPVSDASVANARIQVFSAAEFARMSPITGEVVEMLKKLKPGEVPGQMVNGSKFDPSLIPFPPVVTGNKQMFYEKFHTIEFKGGKGYAYITQYAFEPRTEPAWKMSGFTYVFVGLGGDDDLIVGTFPVTAKGLPEKATDFDASVLQSNYQGYVNTAKKNLGSLQPGDFTPNLDQIDQMLLSIEAN